VDAPVETAAQTASTRRSALARFARDRRGVAALEFAMVSIPFFGLLCATFETAFVYFNHEVFDNAVEKVARQILVNQNQYSTAAQTATAFKNATGANGYSLCGSLPSYFDCNKVIVNISTPSDKLFATAATNTTEAFIANPTTNVTVPAPGAIVVFQAFYPMPIYLSVLLSDGTNLYKQTSGSVMNSSGTMVHKIYSVVVFRNEPS